MDEVLSIFDASIARWFDETHGSATDIQQQAWPKIAAGDNLLISAPTGSGKTLTAFLWAINQFVTAHYATGQTRVLYISPLKALNNDIQRNLMAPLQALRDQADQAGQPFPHIRVQTRSGDTDQTERRRMLRQPPEILITTPESLNILLTSKSGEAMLRHIETVILDEVHAVVSSKRGAYLMSAVERLVPLAGEFQRISLSATVQPLDRVAGFIAGHKRQGEVFSARPIQALKSTASKRYQVTVRYPEAAANRPVEEKVWDSLAADFVPKIRANRSTLLFVNSRTLAETLTHKINSAAQETLAWAHHGSLSKEIRLDVEQRLKRGELAAIVATGTLEMGIDIGALDEVILIQSPEGIASAIQRIGRAGHGVGETSRCTLYPTHPMDFIESAVLGKAVLEGDIEPVDVVSCPLDVLAQVIISMTSTRKWPLRELFLELRRSSAFQALDEQQFGLVIDMLNGRYGENRIRELRARVVVDQLAGTIESTRGATLALYLSGGVIPDRGYFQLRHENSNARIGELDEEFVWEAQVGKIFAFGTQHWQVKKITHNDVLVGPARPTAIAPPFWTSEGINRSFHFADRIARFLESADRDLEQKGFRAKLLAEHNLEPLIADELLQLLKSQREHTGAALPHRHHLLIETIESAAGQSSGYQIVIHTGWGNRVNRPLGLAMEAAWHERWGERPEIFVTDQCLVMQLLDDVDAHTILGLVQSDKIEHLLRKRLEGSGFFGARFRENAGRALLLAKGKFNERKPLWMSRLQSQKLLDVVQRYDDFPILLETWRTCLRDEFDLPSLRLVLDEIASGDITVSEVRGQQPSPFARTVAWDQVNDYMYRRDQPGAPGESHLSRSLLESLVFQPSIRPAIPAAVIDDFVLRRQRTLPGYEPETESDVLEWVKERSVIPMDEWWTDIEVPPGATQFNIGDRRLVVAEEDVTLLTRQLQEASPTLLSNWLQYYGPVRLEDVQRQFDWSAAQTAAALAPLVGDQTLIMGELVQDSPDTFYCDAANFEVLLRLLRQRARIDFKPQPLALLAPFLYGWQTRHGGHDSEDQVAAVLETLQALPLPAAHWEQHVLPARVAGYDHRDLDQVLQSGALIWAGAGAEAVQFCYQDNLGLLQAPESFHAISSDAEPAEGQQPAELPATQKAATLFRDPNSRYDFLTLQDTNNLTTAALSHALWSGVWQGQVSNDGFRALRTGIQNKFQPPEVTASTPPQRRMGFRNWKQHTPLGGNWYLLQYPAAPGDSLDREEQNKDRVRQLLDRYGIVFRELLLREAPAFRWASLFRSIRLMELAGELHSGYFFEDIPGPQFLAPSALSSLSAPRRNSFWINATDPISPCGLFPADNQLPRRVAGNYLVYREGLLSLVVEQQGKKLSFQNGPEDPALSRDFGIFHFLLGRRGRGKVTLSLINGEPARASPYLAAFEKTFDLVKDHKTVYLQKRYTEASL